MSPLCISSIVIPFVILIPVTLSLSISFILYSNYDPDLALNFDLSTAYCDSRHNLHSDFDHIFEFDLGLVLDFDSGFDFQFQFSPYVQYRSFGWSRF
ncbi:hypothetical protein EVAR_103725_1 [Eumeta japonica]|uniref:Uncharacterized protein n=1 Tax=Eumeta variegata TaxID=151549 RepID=A0A4C1ZJ23_EUMVA|nr:hypothetical protein EVAR_103725_1 [Eumeta japonica]